MEMMMNKLIPEVCLLLIIFVVYCWFLIIKNLLEWNRSLLICLSDHHQQNVQFSMSSLYPLAILIGYHCNLTANSKYTCICTCICMYVYWSPFYNMTVYKDKMAAGLCFISRPLRNCSTLEVHVQYRSSPKTQHTISTAPAVLQVCCITFKWKNIM